MQQLCYPLHKEKKESNEYRNINHYVNIYIGLLHFYASLIWILIGGKPIIGKDY